MDCAVVVVAYERRDHLACQLDALAHQTCPADRVVVVDLGGPRIARRDGSTELPLAVVALPAADPATLLLSRARNVGWRAANASTTIFLDVDCAPTVTLVADYAARVRSRPGVWSGPVGYLPPGVRPRPGLTSPLPSARFHPGRPRPGQSDAPVVDDAMFWSLSFAVDRVTWGAIGGFDERFCGYGGEDTDFGRSATAAGAALWFTGAAVAHHQHHPVSSPPIEHLDAICRNATVFYDKWGSWPMTGWLQSFAVMGLIEWDPAGAALRRIGAPSPAEDGFEIHRAVDQL